jgi:hypothetical protein
MTIARHDGRLQVCCDACPSSYPNTYAAEDFPVMIADAKAAGWIVRPAGPQRDSRDTSDLFGSAPRVAGRTPPDRFTHTCPACASPAPATLFNPET